MAPLDAYSASGIARLLILAALAGGATAWDLRTRRVPDLLTLSCAVAGVLLGAAEGGVGGAGRALLGVVAGGGIFLPLVALGYVGSGDLKLLAAAGALLGPGGALRAVLLGALLGGLWALAWLAAKGRQRALPYAPPLAAGAVLSYFLSP